MAQVQYQAVGRRKKAIARVRLIPGEGKIVINGRDIDNYFGLETLKLIVRSPLVLLGLEGKYDVVVRVSGGGVSGRAESYFQVDAPWRRDQAVEIRIHRVL